MLHVQIVVVVRNFQSCLALTASHSVVSVLRASRVTCFQPLSEIRQRCGLVGRPTKVALPLESEDLIILMNCCEDQ